MILAGSILWLVGTNRQQPTAKSIPVRRPSQKTLAAPITNEYEPSVQSGQDYLRRTVASINPSLRLILDYLQRKYGLYGQFSALENPIGYPQSGQHDDTVAYPAFRRFAYPHDVVSHLPALKNDPITQMMMAAANCDHIALQSDFGDLVQSNINAGGYNLTHVAFSLRRMGENNCHYFSAAQTQMLENEVATGMASIVAESNTTPDLRYEAIAFLLDLGRPDLVSKAWIDQIMAEQQAGGGWPAQIGQLGDVHASVLALWALLGYTRPNAASEPMIRH